MSLNGIPFKDHRLQVRDAFEDKVISVSCVFRKEINISPTNLGCFRRQAEKWCHWLTHYHFHKCFKTIVILIPDSCVSGCAHELQRWITCFLVLILWLITERRQWRRCSVEMNICRRRGNCRRCSFPLRLQPQIYSSCQEYCPYGRWRDVSDIRRSETVNVVSIYSSITWREQQPSQGLSAWTDKGKMLTASVVSVIF